jgi:hypothetical protein
VSARVTSSGHAVRMYVLRFWLSGVVLVSLALLVLLAKSPVADFIGGAGLVIVSWTIFASIPSVRRHYLLSMFRPLTGEVEDPLRLVGERTARQQLAGITISPGEQLIEMATAIDEVPAGAEHPLNVGTPVARASAERIAHAARTAGSAAAASAVARITYPDESEELAAHQQAVARLAEPVAELRPLPLRWHEPPRKVGEPPRTPLVEFATWLSGAPVLIDAMDSRYRVFSDTYTWHRRWYRGRGDWRRYDEDPGQHAQCQTTLGIGDHDARVVDVHGIWRGVHPEAGQLTLVLETGESCYSATESGTDGGIACKHLSPTPYGAPPHEQGLAYLPYGVDLNGALPGRPTGGQIRMLTAYSVLRTADDQLVLARRSTRVRTGLGVLSATAGGVVEVRDLQRGGDLGADGSLDLAGAAARETAEEIGIVLERQRLRPMVLFLANSVGLNKDRKLEGQIVVTALLLARTRYELAEVIAQAAHASDLALGSYEVDRLEGCPIANAEQTAAWCAKNATRIDQHALLGCLYASAVLFGEHAAVEAFLTAFADSPWWLQGVADRGWPRNCVDPGRLVQEGAGADETPRRLAAITPAWRAAWEQARATSDAKLDERPASSPGGVGG